MDADLLPCCERNHPSYDRLAGWPLWSQAAAALSGDRFYSGLVFVWSRALAWLSDHLSYYPGCLRRWPAAAVPGGSSGVVPSGKAWPGNGLLGTGNCRCAHAGSCHRRLAHRQLQLAQAFIFDPPYLRRERTGIDYWGIGLLVVGMCSLQIMLDKGQEEDWFGSHFIMILAVLAVVGLGGLIIRELRAEHPVIDLSVFRNRSFAVGTLLMTAVGFVLYGSTVLYPLMMQELLGYTATHAGVTNFPRGTASFLFMPFVGFLTGKIDARKMLAAGLLLTAAAMFQVSFFSLDVGFWDFAWPLILQGAGLGLIFVPLTTVSNDQIPRERMGNATSIFNLMRNIGASVGISSVETLQFRNMQAHINYLGRHVNDASLQTQQTLAGLRQTFVAKGADAVTATHQAHGAMWAMLQRQADMLAYNDVFRFLGWMFLVMVPLILLMEKPKKKGPVIAH